MISAEACQRYLRRNLLRIAVITLVVCAGLIVYARSSSTARGPFGLAEDFPRGPSVYAQFSDLPALIRQWDDSTLKRQYLDSTNFQQFQHRHLALKLVERWEEFNSALGFPLDAATISAAAENRVAMAIYDIGRLDMVFIAPLSEEKIAATRFFQGKEQFEETELPDGTVYYNHDVEADRGRQKQKILFASSRGRFVLATDEQLLLRTLANINGKAKKDHLSDDPSFKALSGEVKPHFATVWVDQSKLNNDWYFKHYWVMGDTGQLRAIRAGMFDLELQDGKWVERREFLYAGKQPSKSPVIPAQDAKRVSEMIPGGVPYFKLQALNNDPKTASILIRDTLFDRLQQDKKGHRTHWEWQSYDDSYFYDGGEDEYWSGHNRYSYLGREYDATIDDPYDARIKDHDDEDDGRLRNEAESRFETSLEQVLQPVHPLFAAIAESPQMNADPLFVEFRRATILSLRTPDSLDRQSLERAISGAAQSRLMIAGAAADLKWVDSDEDGRQWRGLETPMLGWKLCYALRGRELIVANSAELLRTILAGGSSQPPLAVNFMTPIDDLTVIRLDQRKQAFDRVVEKLDAGRVKAYWDERQGGNTSDLNRLSQEFFSGNIASLLNVASRAREIKIKRSSLPGRLREEIEIILK